MKNIFLIALSLIYNFQLYLQQDILIQICLSFIQFYLLFLYLTYKKFIKFVKDKIIK